MKKTDQVQEIERIGPVLGIETSCDDTGLAVYDAEQGLLANVLHSQIEQHRVYGGVVPELASREHIRYLRPLLEEVLHQSAISLQDLVAVAYTRGPGLVGSLLAGSGFAAALAYVLERPLLGIHHLEGHLLSACLADPVIAFPFLALLVSGGHTQLIDVCGLGQYHLLGETLDDAAGEAFDKTAKLLGLPYPGGPEIARCAQTGNADAYTFPQPMSRDQSLNFSFSGLKTAIRMQIERLPQPISAQQRCDLCASVQVAIVGALQRKSALALKQTQRTRLVVVGGVSANKHLREQFYDTFSVQAGVAVHYPPLAYCTDNGAMIAYAGSQYLQRISSKTLSETYAVDVQPRWPLAASMPLASKDM